MEGVSWWLCTLTREDPLLAELSADSFCEGRVVLDCGYLTGCSDSFTAALGLPNFDPCFLFSDFLRIS